MVANALVMSSEPTFWPKVMSTPLQMMVMAVSVQMTMVSAKTSKMPYRPCWTGPLVSAAACAMAAEPRPASLEKALLRRPQTMVCLSAMPLAAPPRALGVKAVRKILAKAGPMLPAWPKMTTKAKMI